MIFTRNKRVLYKISRRVLSKIRTLIERLLLQQLEEVDYSKAFSKYPLLVFRFRKLILQIDQANPAYVWGVICGADLAKELGITHVSVIEFGVAGGNGLVCLEEIASQVEEIYGITIDVYGFDTGTGLPKPKDYWDLPQLWNEGDYPMDKKKLQNRLRRSKLILGPVKDTIFEFIESNPQPIAFMAFDMDLYSSTMDAFKLLDADKSLFLPRIHCYFDDIMGFSYGDFNGERLAITDFNNTHELRKISKIYGLKYYVRKFKDPWVEMMYLVHIFDHDLYGKNDGIIQASELPLDD